jgi:hypothetical protein
MNIFAHIKRKREQRRRVHKAFLLLNLSGVLRRADHDIRRVMNEKELQTLLTEKDAQA